MTMDFIRSVLIVEDNVLNRDLLTDILSETYDVLTASNGLEALQLLERHDRQISVILLDMQMPVMDGYAFLHEIQNRARLAHIPVIVTSSSSSDTDEIRCLDMGASDFVSKPYNTEIVLKRVERMIRLSEASLLVSKMEFDALTGVYGKESFLIHANQLLKSNPAQKWDMLCTDIDSFKMINDRYGTERGDQLLCYTARLLRSIFGAAALIGRLSGDIFAVMAPHQEPSFYQMAAHTFEAALKQAPVPNPAIHLGLLPSIETDVPVSLICDNCLVAIESIHHQYGHVLAEFDQEIKARRRHEQMILESMEEALQTHQFDVYYQPKFNMKEQKPGGAEALIRWNHPELGFLSPGIFIPLFEKNGFIHQLDTYVREQVVRDLDRWRQAGLPVVPISMNVSRADFDDPHLVDSIRTLVEDHQIPKALFHLEVTESAYAQSPGEIERAVNQLREYGFQMELDDFGSGYSSLNLLINLDMDVLKLDMSLVQNMNSSKQQLILAHIFSIARTLGMEVVAEGVETARQAECLRDMGCTYAQGYYYSRPLRVDQFEEYLNQYKEVLL